MNVLFQTRGGGLYGWLIRLWTRSNYIHCALEFSDGQRFSADVGTGTCFLPPLPPEQEFGWDRVFVATTPEQEQAILHFCQGEVGCSYDWRGVVFSQVLGLGWESSSKWFCSEVCDAAFLEVLPHWPTFRPCKVSPKRLGQILQDRRAAR